ncbi:MAG: hypothetical protein Fur0020_09120 [Thermodesulfovibrionia bacterium]
MKGSWSINSRGGFTLLELIIVISLITLILGLSTVFLAGSLSSSRLSSTVRDMVTAIRHARNLAQTTGTDKSLIIDIDSKEYSIDGDVRREIPHDVNIKVVDDVNGREIDSGSFRMVFYAGGGIEGGRIILWNEKKGYAIDIDPITGAKITE